MPLFEYQCRECQQTTEVLIRDGVIPRCKHCGSTRLEKQLGRITPKTADSAPPACAGCCEAASACPVRGGCRD